MLPSDAPEGNFTVATAFAIQSANYFVIIKKYHTLDPSTGNFTTEHRNKEYVGKPIT